MSQKEGTLARHTRDNYYSTAKLLIRPNNNNKFFSRYGGVLVVSSLISAENIHSKSRKM